MQSYLWAHGRCAVMLLSVRQTFTLHSQRDSAKIKFPLTLIRLYNRNTHVWVLACDAAEDNRVWSASSLEPLLHKAGVTCPHRCTLLSRAHGWGQPCCGVPSILRHSVSCKLQHLCFHPCMLQQSSCACNGRCLSPIHSGVTLSMLQSHMCMWTCWTGSKRSMAARATE